MSHIHTKSNVLNIYRDQYLRYNLYTYICQSPLFVGEMDTRKTSSKK